MPIGDVLPEIALLLTAVITLLTASFVPHERQRLCAPLALLGLAIAAGLTITQAGGAARLTFQGTWALDGATTTGRLLIVSFAALAIALAPDWLETDRRHGEFYAILLFSTLGAVLMAGATDTMQLVVAVLLSSVTGFTLAAYHRDWPASVEAGMKYFLLGALANVLLVTGVVLLFGLVGDTAYGATSEALWVRAEGGGGLEVVGLEVSGLDWGAVAAIAFVVVGLAYKLAAFPAYAWLPDVAEGSPAPSAAFLSVVPKIGALVALARLGSILPDPLAWRALVAALALVTMTIGNLGALWQTDVRRLVGWSAVSQSGYALIAVAALGRSELALPALLFFLAGYAAANTGAFAVIAHLRGRTKIEDYRGLGGARPFAAAGLAVAFLSLVGIPPLAGFVGKLLVFGAAIDAGLVWLAVLGVANTVLSLFYYLRVLGPAYFDAPPGRVHVLGSWSRWTAVVAAVATLGLGVAAEAVWPMLAGMPFLVP